MHNNSKIAKAIRIALIFTASATAAFSTTTFAEEVVEEAVEEIEKIQVTGSRISRSDMETASPVTIIDASAIAASGAISIDGLLQQLTVSGGAMTNPGVNNGSGGNASINLRGLGSQRTLVLLNGRRMIASGTGAASTVDLNTIPVSMIERLEILKDGASAVYGTDAISGVVNVILKRDFDGFEANIQTGISGQSDAKETSVDFTLGNTFEEGNVVFGLQYTDRGDASQGDRDFSDCPIAEAENASGDLELYCGGSSYSEGGHIWGETADLSGKDGTYHDFGDADRYNYAADSYLSTPMQRINLSVAGTYELAEDINFFTEATYTKRWSEQQMAPQPIWNSDTWIYDPISAGGFMTDELLDHGIVAGEALDYGRRMTDTGSRDFSQVVDTVRIIVGVEGILANDWAWDVSYNKGRNDSVDTLANLHNIGSINDAVQAGEFDPFTQASWQGDSIAPFVYTEVNAGGSEMDIFAATITGDVAELPAGTVGFAAGYEHRSESAYYTPDSLTAQGLANDPRVESTAGGFSVDEAYVEFAVPLLANLPIAKAVELSAAVRYFDYSTFGDDATWKLGLTWAVNDEVMLRSVVSTAYRAPTVDELYGGASPSFDQIVHPATDQTQAEVTVGGNPLLTPEEADIMTLGVVYEPSYIDGLSLTLDYYDIDITNAIDAVDSNYIANQCLSASGETINTGTALCQAADISIDGTGRVAFNNGLQNIGGQSTSGYDINVAYNFEAADLNWRVSLDTSILDTFDQVDQDGVVTDYTGLITGGSGSYADLKTNFNISVNSDDWRAGYEIRYISGMDSFSCIDDPSVCYAPTVGAVMYHDVTAAYHLNDTVTFSGGINNLLDEEPPYYTGNNDSNTDPYTYDVLGRYFFVKATVKF